MKQSGFFLFIFEMERFTVKKINLIILCSVHVIVEIMFMSVYVRDLFKYFKLKLVRRASIPSLNCAGSGLPVYFTSIYRATVPFNTILV
jgi:hypothetical protein